ncbi:TonB-dependent receptor [Chryseobacterium indologenes]|uniref:TonB-dependent receptor n=1 Tax=Chryseobacterium indologenes TaxID=253 RepID=A0AAD0YZ89_CHRID|nr:outer membrane beta-barrel family protein [Chryseobacterium indologenes]ASE63954.1 TonB-dependent receptor [Chryseobacterium indologenes]AYZ37129.1 TonB-dependent receptor [Chryseobacterium indologenes]AZB19743.1 TonB-dependent receptor [Chryseobacterium indologenes]MEB4761025.1 outer membrane beta-barrel family protein [Chryseobacterium indologenes]
MKKVFSALSITFTIFAFSQEKKNDSVGKLIEKEIQEVEIKARKKLVERKIDRLVFNVQNSTSATGGDAMDALRVTPGVKVINDKISIIGKSGVSVLIDDKIMHLAGDDLANFLKTIPSDQIKSIEVITTPPAKYDAQGNGGLINIVLKKTKKNSWNATIRSSYKQATYATGNLGADFSFQKDKITLFSSINTGDGTRKNIDNSSIYYPEERWENKSPRKIENKFLSTRLGLDYDLTNKLSMGFQYLGSFSEMNINENNTASYIYDSRDYLKSYIISKAKSNEKPNLNQFNFHTIYKLDSLGKKISFDVDYFSLKDKNTRNYNGNSWDKNDIPQSYFAAINNNNQDITNYSGKIDAELPLEWAKLSFGGKISQSRTHNNVVFYDNSSGTPIIDEKQTNEFDFTENTQALYFSANKKLGEKWEANVGLRAENTQTKGYSRNLDQENKNTYFQLFPTAYLAYTPNDNHSFNMTYSRRINRPNYNQLNPFRIYDNPYSYVEGNPFLKPSYTSNFEFIYTFDNLESKIYYSYEKNGFEQLGILDNDTKITRYFVLNFLKTYNIGLTENISFNPVKFWTTTNSFDINYTKSTSDTPITVGSLNGWNTYLSTDNEFSLNSKKTLSFNVGYWISLPGVNGVDKVGTNQSLYAGLKFLMLDKNLQLSIIANDILKTQKPVYTSYSNGIKTMYRNYYDTQFFTLSLSYKFGNQKLKVSKHNFGNQEEKNRTGK